MNSVEGQNVLLNWSGAYATSLQCWLCPAKYCSRGRAQIIVAIENSMERLLDSILHNTGAWWKTHSYWLPRIEFKSRNLAYPVHLKPNTAAAVKPVKQTMIIIAQSY